MLDSTRYQHHSPVALGFQCSFWVEVPGLMYGKDTPAFAFLSSSFGQLTLLH